MKRKTVTTVAALATAILWSGMALADGHKTPNGKHYNLNIIGVEKTGNADMTGSNRHTIFVPLETKSKGVRSVKNDYQNGPDNDGEKTPDVDIHTQIWLMPGADFRVCDGNGFDLAYGCDDNPLGDWDTCAFVDDDNDATTDDVYQCGVISRKEGAVFELPCNQNLTDDQDGYIACGEDPEASYEVYARALGGPGGTATLTTCASVQIEDESGALVDELQCSTENTVQSRTKGQSLWNEVTDELTSMVVDLCLEFDGFGECLEYETTRIALFSGDTEDWFWNYQNDGLRLLQLRFYDI